MSAFSRAKLLHLTVNVLIRQLVAPNLWPGSLHARPSRHRHSNGIGYGAFAVRDKGFDHTTQGAYAAAAGVAKALGLSQDGTANAIAISGRANVALRVTRTGVLSPWKGLAYPNTAMAASHAALLAAHGIWTRSGFREFKETIGGPFEINWLQEGLERVCRTILKKHNAEIHAQSALDAVLGIRARPEFDVRTVRTVRLKTFEVAYKIIGGGEDKSESGA